MLTLEADSTIRAVKNLAFACAGAKPGARLLILEEPHELGHYGAALASSVADAAEKLDINVTRLTIGFTPEPKDLPEAALSLMSLSDHILYLARLGDQMRFRPLPYAERSIVSYALTRRALASSFCTVPHDAMLALKSAINAAIATAREIRITCPLGSNLRGRARLVKGDIADVGILRFPLAVFAPVPMEGFSGRIALARFLVGTGSIYYEPFLHPIDGVVMVHLNGTHAEKYEGSRDAVAGLRSHVGAVAGRFGLEADFVHSWHAGIHPGCSYEGRAEDNPGRWTGSAFGNPRLLHFHTCGAYAPGEICWNVLDPTITLDGVELWQGGKLHPERISGAEFVLEAYPELAALFEAPEMSVGIV